MFGACCARKVSLVAASGIGMTDDLAAETRATGWCSATSASGRRPGEPLLAIVILFMAARPAAEQRKRRLRHGVGCVAGGSLWLGIWAWSAAGLLGEVDVTDAAVGRRCVFDVGLEVRDRTLEAVLRGAQTRTVRVEVTQRQAELTDGICGVSDRLDVATDDLQRLERESGGLRQQTRSFAVFKAH